MTRPDVVFMVTVSPVAYVHRCAVRQEQEERGFFGFHPPDACPTCQVEPAGWEMWGENGHRQGGAKTREMLAHMLRHLAQSQWRMRDGRLMGYRFRQGREIRYQGNNLA